MSLLIGQITDIHIGFDPGNPDEYNMERLRAVVARVASAPSQPDLVLLTGDLSEHGDAESYARLVKALAPLGVPLWPMVGNHDTREGVVAAFPQVWLDRGFLQYVIELSDFRIVMLDTLEPGRHGGGFCAARADWLANQLAAHPATPTLIAMHHPPFESGIAWLDGDAREPWMARFVTAIAGHNQVVGIISGHLHRTIATGLGGMPLVVAPSTAPAVALDLTPIDPATPDGRVMITTEEAGYALHRWDGTRLISHFETVGSLNSLARYDAALLETVQIIAAERP
ncbi:MAG TPA: phosphodiesterase [Novosphingobium sp.]|nr:phosphodiesterase [Novosphingobium sp.]